MATTVKTRISELARRGKKPAEIMDIVKKEGLKTKLGKAPSIGYVGMVSAAAKKKTAKRRQKTDLPTLVNVPLDSPDQVCIVFGSSEKVERALGMLRDIYQTGR